MTLALGVCAVKVSFGFSVTEVAVGNYGANILLLTPAIYPIDISLLKVSWF